MPLSSKNSKHFLRSPSRGSNGFSDENIRMTSGGDNSWGSWCSRSRRSRRTWRSERSRRGRRSRRGGGVGVVGVVVDRVALGLETSRITVLRLHTVWLSGWRPLELVQHVHPILSDTSEASWRFVRDRQGWSGAPRGGSGVPWFMVLPNKYSIPRSRSTKERRFALDFL